jgi:hypothetical protein
LLFLCLAAFIFFCVCVGIRRLCLLSEVSDHRLVICLGLAVLSPPPTLVALLPLKMRTFLRLLPLNGCLRRPLQSALRVSEEEKERGEEACGREGGRPSISER